MHCDACSDLLIRASMIDVGRCYIIIKYWLKILMCDDCKYIKYIYKMILLDLAVVGKGNVS